MLRFLAAFALLALVLAVPTPDVVASGLTKGWVLGRTAQPAQNSYWIEFTPTDSLLPLNIVVYHTLGTAADIYVNVTDASVFPNILLSSIDAGTPAYETVRATSTSVTAGTKTYINIVWPSALNDEFWVYIYPDVLNKCPPTVARCCGATTVDSEPNDAKAQPVLRYPSPLQYESVRGWLTAADVDLFLVNVPAGHLFLSARFDVNSVVTPSTPKPPQTRILPAFANVTFSVTPAAQSSSSFDYVYSPAERYINWIGVIPTAGDLTIRLGAAGLPGGYAFAYTLEISLLQGPDFCQGSDEDAEPNDGVHGPASTLKRLDGSVAGQLCLGDSADVYRFTASSTGTITMSLLVPSSSLPGVEMLVSDQLGLAIACAGPRCEDSVGKSRANYPFLQPYLTAGLPYMLRIGWSGAPPSNYLKSQGVIDYVVVISNSTLPSPSSAPANCSNVELDRVVLTLAPPPNKCQRTPLKIKEGKPGVRAPCGISSFTVEQNIRAFQAAKVGAGNRWTDYVLPASQRRRSEIYDSPANRLNRVVLEDFDTHMLGYGELEAVLADGVALHQREARDFRKKLPFAEPCPVPKDWTLYTCPATEFCALNDAGDAFECQPKANDGEPCDATTPCNTHGPYELRCYVPEGASDAVCGQTGYLSPGESCDSSDQCVAGAPCVGGTCQFAATGEECIRVYDSRFPDTGSLCRPGEYCSFMNIASRSPSPTSHPGSPSPTVYPTPTPVPPLKGVCAAIKTTGDSCEDNAECPQDHRCAGRKCVKRYTGGLGDPCYAVTFPNRFNRTDDVCHPSLSCSVITKACARVPTPVGNRCTRDADCSAFSDPSVCRCNVESGHSTCKLLRNEHVLDLEQHLLRCAAKHSCDASLPLYAGSCVDRECYDIAQRFRKVILNRQADELYSTPDTKSYTSFATTSTLALAVVSMLAMMLL